MTHDPSSMGELLSEVINLADQKVTARLPDNEVARRLEQLKTNASKPKRQVSYNQDAVLCSGCNKRIRLNNDGRLRVHKVGKINSSSCDKGKTLPAGKSEPAPPGNTAVAALLTEIFSAKS